MPDIVEEIEAIDTSQQEINVGTTSVIPTDDQQDIQQRSINRGLTAIRAAEEERKKRRAQSRQPNPPHERRQKWPMWAKEVAFKIHTDDSNLTHSQIASKMSGILSGSQGGVHCNVPVSTISNWIKRAKKDSQIEESQYSLLELDQFGQPIETISVEHESEEAVLGRPVKISDEHKYKLLEWHFKEKVITAEKLAKMLTYYIREEADDPQENFSISASSVRRVLKDANLIWKMARSSRPVVFTSSTAIASVRYAHAYQRFLEKSGASEVPSQLIFGDETTFSAFEVPTMVWAEKGIPSRVIGDDGKGGISTFVFLNGAGSVVKVIGNIKQSNGIETSLQLLDFLKWYDEKNGLEAGLLLILDNATWHHQALSNISKGHGFYPPCNAQQASLWGNAVPIEPLDADNNNGSLSRAQFYILRKETSPGADDGRYVLMTPPGMCAFQAAELLFKSCKDRLARVNTSFKPRCRVQRIHVQAIEKVLSTIPRSVVKGCLRSTEHFRQAWLAKSQAAVGGVQPLSFEDVEMLISKHKKETERPTRRDVGSYSNEKDILLGMLSELGGAIQVRFKLPGQNKVVVIGDTGRFSDECLDGGSIVLFNPDDMNDMELSVKKKFLEGEAASQDPNFTWEYLPNPRARTVQILNQQKQDLEKLLAMERRAREYCHERNIVNQCRRVCNASRIESGAPSSPSPTSSSPPAENPSSNDNLEVIPIA